jgi:hypothetical protein
VVLTSIKVKLNTLPTYIILSILTFQSLAVSLRTTKFNIQKFYMMLALRYNLVRISEQTAIFASYFLNWLVFITVVESVYSAVQTDVLYKAN